MGHAPTTEREIILWDHPVTESDQGRGRSRGARVGGRHRRPLDRQATYGEVFGVGEFRSLWLAQALSFIGDQFAQVALAVLVYDNTKSTLLTALVYALTYIPPIVGGPVLSGLADLFPRRTVMVVCDVLRAGL